MRSSRQSIGRFTALFIVCISLSPPLAANPFMGAGTGADGTSAPQASPVRTSAADQNLVTKQANLRDSLGTYFYSWKKRGSPSVFWGIIGVAFLYGILHALGPGHRKTVIFSLYLARKAPAWEPAGTGFLLALLHAGAAVVLLLILRGVSGAISGKADNITIYMEGFAYVLLIAVALYLVAQAIRGLLRGTGNAKSDAMSLGTILLTGIYPCPGAILVLVLSLTLDITGIGILAVFAMSLGMSIPIIASGYLAWFGRTGIFLALKSDEAKLGRISALVELFGYSFLLIFAFYMAEPFILSLAKITFR
jgi:ABC-type nickel/cobalt efflux system permease component RcnA